MNKTQYLVFWSIISKIIWSLGYTSVFSLLASPLRLNVYVAIAKDVLFGNYSASSCDRPTEMEFFPPSSIPKKSLLPWRIICQCRDSFCGGYQCFSTFFLGLEFDWFLHSLFDSSKHSPAQALLFPQFPYRWFRFWTFSHAENRSSDGPRGFLVPLRLLSSSQKI